MSRRSMMRGFAILMFAVALMFLLPLVLMILTSFKVESEVLNPRSLWPRPWTTSNYLYVLQHAEEAPFVRWLLNSLFISTSVTLLVLIVSSTAAYALTRLRLAGADRMLGGVVLSMMLPGQLFLVPMYLLLGRLGWLDSPTALIVPAAASAFGVFMLASFMRAIPQAIEEAAIVDGCSSLGVFLHVTLPLSAPTLATLGIFTFIGSWNDFLAPLVYMDSIQNYTLPVGIALYQSSYYTEYGLTLATSVLASLPLLIVFSVFQRQIIQSMSSSGLKE